MKKYNNGTTEFIMSVKNRYLCFVERNSTWPCAWNGCPFPDPFPRFL